MWGLSLRIYLSRPDGIYQKSVWQYMRYCLKVDKPLYSNNTMTLIRYESNENKCISKFILLMNMLSLSRQLSRPVCIYYEEQVYNC